MQWFESWFDSPYYHILYQNRDEKEAEAFIDALYKRFEIMPHHTILDLACGKGRHSLYMGQKNNLTIGVDLSPNSISEAKKMALKLNLNDKVKFQVEDMRNFNLGQHFDFVLNLFTSFGYFEDKMENSDVISSIASHQKEGGIVLIDYLNSQLVRENGEIIEIKTLSGIKFKTHKTLSAEHVIKNIQFVDKGIEYQFQEKVQLFNADEIESMLKNQNYDILGHFGDYQLGEYTKKSPRSIIVGIKKG